MAPGTESKLELWHKGKSRDISLSLGEMDLAANSVKVTGHGSKDELGLEVRQLTQEERKQAEVDQGLLVENVDGGPAARAGIRQGDIILSVNGEKTATIKQLNTLVAGNSKHVALLILRGEHRMFVPITMG
jgi:serine protease Do